MNPTINEDNQLLQALQRGEETAFDRLFRKYYPLCCAYGIRFVNPEDAKELAGDAIAWLWGTGRTSALKPP